MIFHVTDRRPHGAIVIAVVEYLSVMTYITLRAWGEWHGASTTFAHHAALSYAFLTNTIAAFVYGLVWLAWRPVVIVRGGEYAQQEPEPAPEPQPEAPQPKPGDLLPLPRDRSGYQQTMRPVADPLTTFLDFGGGRLVQVDLTRRQLVYLAARIQAGDGVIRSDLYRRGPFTRAENDRLREHARAIGIAVRTGRSVTLTDAAQQAILRTVGKPPLLRE